MVGRSAALVDEESVVDGFPDPDVWARMTVSQKIALHTLTMADDIASSQMLPSGILVVAIGESQEVWRISRRGRKEIDDGSKV